MSAWRYIKGSEKDFIGAPEWALYCAQVKTTSGIVEAWEGEDNRYCYTPRGEGADEPFVEYDDNGFIKWGWNNPVTIIAQRERVTSINDDRLARDMGVNTLITERGIRYGKFKDGAEIMRDLKHVMHEVDGWNNLTPSQKEALDMIQHKIGRILNGDPTYDDSWKDIAGYATLIVEELNGVSK